MKLKPNRQYKIRVSDGDLHTSTLTVGVFFNYINEGTTYSDFDVTETNFPALRGEIISFASQLRMYKRASTVIPVGIMDFGEWIEGKVKDAYGVNCKVEMKRSI